MYYLVYTFFYLVSLLPLRVLYVLSDVGYLILYHLLKYRRTIVRRNLLNSFPEKGEQERREIERKFYRWFSDYFVEAVKLLSISKRQLKKRFSIINSEDIEACFQDGQSVAAILGHYCNWEWLSCVGIDLPPHRKMGLVYKPLDSDLFDRLFRDIRSCVGGVPVPRKEILRYLFRYRKEGVMSIFGYISDQTPRWENIHLWLTFMNQETPVFTGAERIMCKMNNAVYYVQMSRPRRGYYTCTYHLITKDPRSLPEHEITRRFFQMLEQTIRRQPQFYLWTHNRWKRTHEQFNKEFKVVHGKVFHKEVNDEKPATDAESLA